MSARSKLDYVQGLRGVAAMAVVLYHARVFLMGPRYHDLGPRLFDTGAAGVDLFFVLSGFIMVHTTRQLRGGGRDAARFFVKRLARIWPAYAIAFAAMVALTWTLTNPAFQTGVVDTTRTLLFLPRDPRSAAPFYGYPVLHVGWSLVYEVWFYLVFALALLGGRWRHLLLAAAFVGTLIAWPLVVCGTVHADALAHYRLRGYANVITNPMVWEFAFGVAIGWSHRWLAERVVRGRGVAAVLVALALAAVLWQHAARVHGGHGPLRWGLPAALLVLALAIYDHLHAIWVPRWLVWLGDVSFSLYLFHILPQMLPRLAKGSSLMTGAGFFGFCLVTALVLAWASHRLLERGLSEWVRRRALERLP